MLRAVTISVYKIFFSVVKIGREVITTTSMKGNKERKKDAGEGKVKGNGRIKTKNSNTDIAFPL